MKEGEFMESTVITENDETTFCLEDFTPEIYDCEADGSCGSGHIHVNVKS